MGCKDLRANPREEFSSRGIEAMGERAIFNLLAYHLYDYYQGKIEVD